MKFRHEYKHAINLSDMMCLERKLSAICRYDSHAEADGTYFIKSLYFDNYLDKALREKIDGVNFREKFRIRYYGNDTSFIRLEKKSKIDGMCNKVSAPISARMCEDIIHGNIDFMLESNIPLMQEFYAKMHYQMLRPKCIVGYTRKCFVHPMGNVRVTLDYGIGGSTNVNAFLNPGLRFVNTFRGAILEVKWDEYIPSVIMDAVQTHCRHSAAFSKYAAVRI
ncbi:MAG: polyphosphate polymerase domain-containing protein [Ruminococcaceae bacterium]|nr:polyphosphate polymerase domain-containing protein [Oscillospiraceae bacterium]